LKLKPVYYRYYYLFYHSGEGLFISKKTGTEFLAQQSTRQVNCGRTMPFISWGVACKMQVSHQAIGKEGWSVDVEELSQQFNLQVAAGRAHLDRQIQGGYCGDLLSDVMANAPGGCIWLTVQTHQNIVSVAVLHGMAAIILTGGREPDQETVEKAEAEGIPILTWPATAYELAGKVYSAGIVNP